jgi:predicted site-specific integrase-resolvase
MSNDERFMSARKFAKQLGVPYATVRTWLYKGKIEGAFQIKDDRLNHWDIPESALEEFSEMRPKRGRPKGAKNKPKAKKA